MAFIRIICITSLFILGTMAGAASEEQVEVGFPKAGTRLVFDKITGDKHETIAWTVIDDSAHRNRVVKRLISNIGFEFYDSETKSWVATMLHDNMHEVYPHNGQLSTPLWVGKSWPASFNYTRRDGSTVEQNRIWTVEARETVSVPAGNFDSYRIHSSGDNLTITLWYAPELNFFVKRLTEGVLHVEQVLLEYRQP